MPSYTALGLVIDRRNLGETDRILTLFTRERGKLFSVAKGSRRPGSRLSGATELFTESRFLMATGRTLDIVTQCEIGQSYSRLRNDLELLARATYVCELLGSLTAERDAASSEELYDLTAWALRLLGSPLNYRDGVVHAYELRLLSLLGYEPVLDRCVQCGGAVKRYAAFSPAMGGLVCASDRDSVCDAIPLTASAVNLLVTLQAAGPETLLTMAADASARNGAARALRLYLQHRAERNLKSAEFLESIRAAGQVRSAN